MRITHLCLAGTITDGWSYQENLITKYQRKDGHAVSIITSEWVYNKSGILEKSNNDDYYLEDGIHVLRLRIKNKDDLTYRFKKYIGVIEALEKTSPQILFIHGCQFLDISEVIKYLKSHNDVKVYVDNHADFSNSATNFISRNILHGIIWKNCAHKIAPFVTRFYGVLPARVDFLKNVYKLPNEKCELLVMGADDDLVKKASTEDSVISTRAKYGIEENDFLIVTGGKIDKAKSQTILLLEAVQNIENEHIRLIVFGPISNELKDKVGKLIDGSHIQYISWLNAEESYRLFGAAQLAIFPGRHSVYWEQVVGQGIPMVVKRWPGTDHVDVGGNVEFLVEDSSEEMQKVIENIVSQSGRYSEMKKTAREKGMVEFSYQNIARRAIEVRGI